MRIDPNGTFFLLTCLIVGLIAGAVIGGTVGGVVAHNNAVANGYTGWDLVGKTALGVLGGAVIGAAIGAVVGAPIGACTAGLFAGSFTASTTAVINGMGTFSGIVSLGGLGSGMTFLADNFSNAVNNAVLSGPILGEKIKYVFGQATGSQHNIDRSLGMLKQLNSIGIFEDISGKMYISQKLIISYYAAMPVLQENGRYLRDILVMGPNGGLAMQTIWDGAKLITIILFGG